MFSDLVDKRISLVYFKRYVFSGITVSIYCLPFTRTAVLFLVEVTNALAKHGALGCTWRVCGAYGTYSVRSAVRRVGAQGALFSNPYQSYVIFLGKMARQLSDQLLCLFSSIGCGILVPLYSHSLDWIRFFCFPEPFLMRHNNFEL